MHRCMYVISPNTLTLVLALTLILTNKISSRNFQVDIPINVKQTIFIGCSTCSLKIRASSPFVYSQWKIWKEAFLQGNQSQSTVQNSAC